MGIPEKVFPVGSACYSGPCACKDGQKIYFEKFGRKKAIVDEA
jgi:hypothetical protein